MADVITIDSGRTLSVLAIPGQDIRIPTTKSESIFTFGAFRMERDFSSDILSGDSRQLTFNSFSTLSDLNVDEDFKPVNSFSVKNNELNFQKTDPLSYCYFSSFYTAIGDSINNIVNTFPYALLAYRNGVGITVDNYIVTKTETQTTSSFIIPYSSVTNQGDVLINTGSTEEISLGRNIDQFAIQVSGNTTIFDILSYTYLTSTTSPSMQFVVNGELFPSLTATAYTSPVYVRPTNKRLNVYLKSLSRLEKQVWLEQEFLIPNAEIPNQQDLRIFPWPKLIDGFNPDTYGTDFTNYQNNILYAAGLVDDDKTNIMLRHFFPDNFIEHDDEFNDIRYLAEVYSKQFDEVKQFIDALSFAHTLNYDDEESVPTKFLIKLSNLLGWELSDSFNEVDLFESLVGDVENNTSIANLNESIWKKILININWLFKKKGTRDALLFIFKLIGAPDCLITLEEHVYDITKVDPSQIEDIGSPFQKVNENGYINFDASNYIFQEGGTGRGTGQAYIDQWRPEFNPLKRVDNIKSTTGSSEFFGTQNIVNTKELNINTSPAAAIECDVFNWLKSNEVCWNWGSTSYTFAFSALTLPFEMYPDDCDMLCPCILSSMTIPQFLEYIYANSIDPRDRKTNNQSFTSFYYPRLRSLYLFYYYSTNPQSNALTFGKLEYFINLLEVQFQSYFLQLIPATTIWEGLGTEYRNTIFNRQKFVYREGINKGSEFKVELPVNIDNQVTPLQVTSKVNIPHNAPINILQINAYQPTTLKNNIKPIYINSALPEKISSSIKPVYLTSEIYPPGVSYVPYDQNTINI